MAARLVTGVFYERGDAEQAVEALRARGIPTEQIYLETEVMPSADMGWKGGQVSRLERERRFAGQETGLLMGLTFGILSGLGIGALGYTLNEWVKTYPEGGNLAMPAVLATPWLAALVGALIGGIVGYVIGWMVDLTLNRMGAGPPLPAHEALVTVQTDEAHVDQARAGLFAANACHLHVSERSAVTA